MRCPNIARVSLVAMSDNLRDLYIRAGCIDSLPGNHDTAIDTVLKNMLYGDETCCSNRVKARSRVNAACTHQIDTPRRAVAIVRCRGNSMKLPFETSYSNLEIISRGYDSQPPHSLMIVLSCHSMNY